MAVRDITVLIIGGGTGGHISPGIAIYEEMKGMGVNVLFLTGARDRRFSVGDDVAEGDLHYYGAPAFTKNIIKLPFFLIRFLAAMIKSWGIIRKHRVSAVIGMGGYVSAPCLVSAVLSKTPVFLCEQNSIPGKVTSLFEKHARRIYGTFDASRDYLKFRDRFIHAGNPMRKNIFGGTGIGEAKKAFNLSHCRKIVLVLGGSQGAMRINDLIIGLKKEFREEFKEIGFIWSTGSLAYEKYKALAHDSADEGSIYISPYIKKMGLAYRACNIAISRAGAGVMLELAAMGIPSILIPYPFSAMGHQEMNAEVFARGGASCKVSDAEAVPSRIAPMILKMLGNERVMNNMSDRALALSKKDATSAIASDIIFCISGNGQEDKSAPVQR